MALIDSCAAFLVGLSQLEGNGKLVTVLVWLGDVAFNI